MLAGIAQTAATIPYRMTAGRGVDTGRQLLAASAAAGRVHASFAPGAACVPSIPGSGGQGARPFCPPGQPWAPIPGSGAVQHPFWCSWARCRRPAGRAALISRQRRRWHAPFWRSLVAPGPRFSAAAGRVHAPFAPGAALGSDSQQRRRSAPLLVQLGALPAACWAGCPRFPAAATMARPLLAQLGRPGPSIPGSGGQGARPFCPRGSPGLRFPAAAQVSTPFGAAGRAAGGLLGGLPSIPGSGVQAKPPFGAAWSPRAADSGSGHVCCIPTGQDNARPVTFVVMPAPMWQF